MTIHTYDKYACDSTKGGDGHTDKSYFMQLKMCGFCLPSVQTSSVYKIPFLSLSSNPPVWNWNWVNFVLERQNCWTETEVSSEGSEGWNISNIWPGGRHKWEVCWQRKSAKTSQGDFYRQYWKLTISLKRIII